MTLKLSGKSVRRIETITLNSPQGEKGATERTVEKVYVRKKKHSKKLKMFEKMARRAAKANLASSKEYLDRHERSNKDRKNGWARDMFKNLNKAMKKGRKVAKIKSIF